MEYSLHLKSARMTAVRDAIAGARLEICSAGGAVLVSCMIVSGSVNGATLTVPVMEAVATGDGVAAAAHIRSGRTVMIGGLTVGDMASGADIKLGTTRIVPGTVVMLDELAITHS